ncbi:hypothetical protein B0H14DRAFT_3899977 [Mycena olivaceomarginata]|nr:hypothetical protein B0H14DRAFT_3899977 [Mycena olivaceomarginata]
MSTPVLRYLHRNGQRCPPLLRPSPREAPLSATTSTEPPPRPPRLHEEERRVGACTHRTPPVLSSTSTHRSCPALDSADIDDATGAKRKVGTYLPSPSPDTIPRGLLERRPRHTRTGLLVLVLPRAPAQAYPTAYSPQRRPPHTDVASTSTHRRCVRFRLHRALPPADRDDTTGRRGGGRASASARMTPRALTYSPAFGSGYYSSRRLEDGAEEETEGRRLHAHQRPHPQQLALPPQQSTAYSPSTTTAHSKPKRMAGASAEHTGDGR